MKLWAKVLIITPLAGLPAAAIGHLIWPPTQEITPTPGQMPFLIFLNGAEALTFGLGVAFLVVAWPWVKRAAPRARRLTTLTYLATAWSLLNWLPHDDLHIHNGLNVQGVLYIDYGFHLTIIGAAALVAYFVYWTLRAAAGGTAAPEVGADL